MLEGKILRALLLFAVPIFFSQLFQTLYNTVDTVLIGYYLGEKPLAAMGATTALFDLIVGFCVGCGNGFGIIAGQRFGARDEAGLKKTVAQSLLLSLLIGVLLSGLALAVLPGLLRLLNTPQDIFTDALTYISLITQGLLITVFYNLAAGMLRAVGDSITPLIILAVSCVLNIGLDIFCILVLKMGVAGAAVATLAAQGISTIICILWILVRKRLLVPGAADFKVDLELDGVLLAQGLAMGFMSSIVAVGTVILQSAINSLGTLLIAAHTAARRVYYILAMPMFAMMTALATFTAQNTGASQYDRVVEGVSQTNRFSVVYCLVLSILVFFSAGWMITLLTGSTNPVIVSSGAAYLKVNIPFFFALGILCNLRSTLQGLGYKTAPVISSIIELAGKIIFTYMIIPKFGYTGVIWSEPIIWCFMMIFLATMYLRLNLFVEKDLEPTLL